MLEDYISSDGQRKKSRQSLEEEVSSKIEADERWKLIPYDYAYKCIALLLTFDDAIYGIRKRLSPEQVMFERENFTPDKIKQWSEL